MGAQQLDDTFIQAGEDIAATGRLFGIATAPPLLARSESRDAMNVLAGAPLSREFWTWLGLDYASIDIDGSPGSVPIDLNYDEIPQELAGKYAVVTNFGTTEHVANQLQAFKIIHDLAAPDAVMLHVLPASGTLNHGLVCYNPKFFWMLGRSNSYKVVLMTMSRGDQDPAFPDNVLRYVLRYDPAAAARLADCRVPETSLIVVLQKLYNRQFVPPIDVPTGTTTENVVLRERYWSVLNADAFIAHRQAIDGSLPRLRRWAFARSPRWLIAAKRRIFGTRVNM
jgi:hypothetical protein